MSIVTPKQSAKTLNLIADSGISGEQYQAMLESGKLTALLKEFIEIGAPTIDILRAVLDYDMTLEQMIEAGNCYFVNEDITAERFPLNRRESGEVELHIVHFGRDMTTKQVLAELDKQGLRPAELPELLALGVAHPDLQRKFQLVALGSEWQGPRCRVFYPILEGGGRRRLSLGWRDPINGWLDDCRFVAVSK